MSDLPPGWEWTTLGELAAAEPRAITDGPFGSNLKSAHYVNSGPRVIRLQNIGFGEFIDEKAHITTEHFESLRTHEARAGDLVVASLGQDLPRACLIPQTVGPAVVKADCIRVRLHDALNARYVNYALARPELGHAIAAQIHGVGRPRLGMNGIKSLPIPLAPRCEQERIVTSIEEHLSRLDPAVSSIESSRMRIDILTQRMIDSACNPNWPVVHLRELLSERLANGRSVPTDEAGFPVLRLTSVRQRRIDLDQRKGGAWSRADAEPFLVRRGDFLVSRGNGSLRLVGRGGLVDTEPDAVAFPDTLIRIRVRASEYDSRFLSLVWDSTGVRRQIERAARTTAGIYKINQQTLAGVAVPKLPLDRQAQAVERVDAALARVARLRSSTDDCCRRSSVLRRAILSTAFKGQLVAQDRDDEPASLLLKRVRGEMATPSMKGPVREANAT